jgi:hypothetical protein
MGRVKATADLWIKITVLVKGFDLRARIDAMSVEKGR